jgi:hypothetical protein
MLATQDPLLLFLPDGWAQEEGSTPIEAAIIPTPARGPDGVATIVMSVAHAATTMWEFETNVIPFLNGREQRICLRSAPKESYSFAATLTDGEMADIQSRLGYDGSQAGVFLVALTYEGLLISDAYDETVYVPTTTRSDWIYPGSRCVLVSPDETEMVSAIVQTGSTATAIVLDAIVTPTVGEGWFIMPTIPCYLEPEQQGANAPVNAGSFQFRARAIITGNATGDWSPVGATIATYTDPDTSEVYPVYDRRNVVDDEVGRSLLLGSELIDRGGKLSAKAMWEHAQVVRTVNYSIVDDAERQWIKAFVGACRGRQLPFLMPTWQPNLIIASGDASTGTMLVFGPPTVGAADYYAKYFAVDDEAHRWLQLWTSAGAVHYRRVIDCGDNGDGTQDIVLDAPVVGAIAMVSFLEKCRWETDKFPVQWEDCRGAMELSARVIQE